MRRRWKSRRRMGCPTGTARSSPRPRRLAARSSILKISGTASRSADSRSSIRSGSRPMLWGPLTKPRQTVVDISPPAIVKRRSMVSGGMTAELVTATRREKMELRFRAPLHLLAIYEQGVRSDGDTFVDGLPKSTLRDLRRKLIFVPAGHEYREW